MIQDERAEIDAGMVEVDFPLAGPGCPVWLCEELLDDLQWVALRLSKFPEIYFFWL